jgi:hypothetical protein
MVKTKFQVDNRNVADGLARPDPTGIIRFYVSF